MIETRITDRLSYIHSTENPLSADIGIIRDGDRIWLFDVGNNIEQLKDLNDSYNVVISHFHLDHIGNLNKLDINDLYVSKETYRHVNKGIIVEKDLVIGDIHIFPVPSSLPRGVWDLKSMDMHMLGMHCIQK